MIQANECRVGNLLYDKKNNRIVAFHGLTEGHNKVIVNYANGNGIYYLEFDEVEPIRLNEEIFLNYKFEQYNESDVYYIALNTKHEKIVFYVYPSGSIEMLNVDKRTSIKFLSEIKHLHELQNLIFSLTKQDFTTN